MRNGNFQKIQKLVKSTTTILFLLLLIMTMIIMRRNFIMRCFFIVNKMVVHSLVPELWPQSPQRWSQSEWRCVWFQPVAPFHPRLRWCEPPQSFLESELFYWGRDFSSRPLVNTCTVREECVFTSHSCSGARSTLQRMILRSLPPPLRRAPPCSEHRVNTLPSWARVCRMIW